MIMERYWNGEFAICPDCGKAMAKNAWDGGWWCIFGCRKRFDKEGKALVETKKEGGK